MNHLLSKWNIEAKAAEPTTLVPDALTSVAIDQPATGDKQNAYYYVPSSALGSKNLPAPLVVALHQWSATYSDASRTTYYSQAAARGWAMIHPDFRGANDDPKACASDLAVDDVVRAVEYMKANANIDINRIYLAGASGGGHMALSVASRRPQAWAAVSAWVPITDLSKWYYESKSKGSKYYSNIVAACGGAPGYSPEVDAQYYLRSPINFVQNVVSIPVDINTGIHDGHTGSVPISHTLYAFNKLADAHNMSGQKLTQAEIDYMVANEAIPQGTATETVIKANEGRSWDVLFRRTIGNSRVTIFEGGHEMEAAAAFKWFEGKTR